MSPKEEVNRKQGRGPDGHFSLEALARDYLESVPNDASRPQPAFDPNATEAQGPFGAEISGGSQAKQGADLDAVCLELNRMRELLMPAREAGTERNLRLVQSIKQSTMEAAPAGIMQTFRRNWSVSPLVRAASVLLLIQLAALPVLGFLALRNDREPETVLTFEAPPVDPFASEWEADPENLAAPEVESAELFAMAPRGWPSVLDIENQLRLERYRLTTGFAYGESRPMPALRDSAGPMEIMLAARASALANQDWAPPKNLPFDEFGYPTGGHLSERGRSKSGEADILQDSGAGGTSGATPGATSGATPGNTVGTTLGPDPSTAPSDPSSSAEFAAALAGASEAERALVLTQRIERKLDQLVLKGVSPADLRSLVLRLNPNEEGALGRLQRASLRRCITTGAIEPELALRVARQEDLEQWLAMPLDPPLGEAWLDNLSAAAQSSLPPDAPEREAIRVFVAQWTEWARRP